MKKKTTIITEEFDRDGNLINKVAETTEEEDSGYIYPQIYPYYPTSPTLKPEWIYRPGEVTCSTDGSASQ